MNRSLYLTETLNALEFNGKMNSLENLFRKIEDLVFYLEAQGQVKTAEQLLACNWELKARMQCDREEQWLWTFVWIKDKVLRKLGVEAGTLISFKAIAEMEIQAFGVQEVLDSRYVLYSPHHLLIAQGSESSSFLKSIVPY
ncbi:MAG: hypothetical protein MUF75_09560 [Bacteroidia bacterium]|jgi:hypothetical protein|nr:hypothetical protein [Bacteroidia bacterium]